MDIDGVILCVVQSVFLGINIPFVLHSMHALCRKGPGQGQHKDNENNAH